MPDTSARAVDVIAPASVLFVGFFFLNTFLLPGGLLYTTLLTPVFLWLILKRGRWKPLAAYLALMVPLSLYQLSRGVATGIYLKSFLLFSSAAIFIIWAVYFLSGREGMLRKYFRLAALYNGLFLGIAILALAIPFGRELFWYYEPIHPAIPAFPRLKMLVYESSFYAFQVAPVFLFYFLSFVFDRGYKHLSEMATLGFALLLSLSFGVLGGLVVAILSVFILHAYWLLRYRKLFFAAVYFSLASSLAAAFLFAYFPFNPVFERVDFVLDGHDSSANGRTWEAFLMAWGILGKTNYLLGAGLGQIKEAGHQLIVDYYNYEGKWAELVRIPNAMAETLATFGIIGALARILAQVVLFVHTRVYANYYRLALFIFIFSYQFTGSYLTNIYEYLIWMIVFLPVFPEFDKTVKRP